MQKSKFLGVILDAKLNWKDHLRYLSKKIAKTIGILGKARKVFDKSTLIGLYYSFIYPLLLYCVINWGNSDQQNIWPVFKLQKMAIRIICNTRKYSSTSEQFKKLEMLKLPDLYRYSVNIFMYNYINNKLPLIFNDYFVNLTDTHSHNTRKKQSFRIPIYKSKIGNNFIKKRGIIYWQELAESIVLDLTSISLVKRATIKSQQSGTTYQSQTVTLNVYG